MILSFSDPATQDLFEGTPSSRVRRIPADLRRRALRCLDLLDLAESLEDLSSRRGLRLHKLSGDLEGFHSMRVNDQWRLIFRWTEHGSAAVRLIDYHR